MKNVKHWFSHRRKLEAKLTFEAKTVKSNTENEHKITKQEQIEEIDMVIKKEYDGQNMKKNVILPKIQAKTENFAENNNSFAFPASLNQTLTNDAMVKLVWAQTVMNAYGQIMKYNILRTLTALANN